MKSNLLKVCRVIAGYSQKELAKELGINQTTLSRYENESLQISEETKRKVLALLAERGLTEKEIVMLSNLKIL